MESPILIPNPLYEVVFRYLMDDQRVAKLVHMSRLGIIPKHFATQCHFFCQANWGPLPAPFDSLTAGERLIDHPEPA